MAWFRGMWNRQFDQYSSDDNYHWEIQCPRFALGTTGLWSGAGKNHRMRFFIIVTMIMMVFVIQNLSKLFSVHNDGYQFLLWISATSVDIIFIGSLFHIRFNSKIWQSILEEMRLNWLTNSSRENKKVMHRYAECSRKIAFIIAIWKSVAVIFFRFNSLVQVVETVRNSTMKEHGVCYPFSSTNAYVLGSCYAYETITWSMFLLIHVGIDMTLIVFTLHSCAQLIILGSRIKMYEGKIRHSLEEEIPENCSCLMCIVDSHVRICEFIKRINGYLHLPILMRICKSVIWLCFYGFDFLEAITNRKAYAVLIEKIVSSTMMPGTLFLYCWFAEMCQQRSYALGDIAYATDWMTKEPKISRHLIFIIRQTLIPLKITGAKYFILSRSLFKEFILMGISYLSLLVTLKLHKQVPSVSSVDE